MNPYDSSNSGTKPSNGCRLFCHRHAVLFGFATGGMPPFVYGAYLILGSIELDPVKRSMPQCCTTGAGGLSIIVICCPILATLGAVIGLGIKKFFFNRYTNSCD
jgi:hypothetical protein